MFYGLIYGHMHIANLAHANQHTLVLPVIDKTMGLSLRATLNLINHYKEIQFNFYAYNRS